MLGNDVVLRFTSNHFFIKTHLKINKKKNQLNSKSITQGFLLIQMKK